MVPLEPIKEVTVPLSGIEFATHVSVPVICIVEKDINVKGLRGDMNAQRKVAGDCQMQTVRLTSAQDVHAMSWLVLWMLRLEVNSIVSCDTVDVKGALIGAIAPGGGCIHGAPPREWQPREFLDGHGVVWKLRTSLCLLRTAPRRWQERFGAALGTIEFVSGMLAPRVDDVPESH